MITAIVITKLIKHFLDARASKESTETTKVDSNLNTNNNSTVA